MSAGAAERVLAAPPAEPEDAEPARSMRLAVVGMSNRRICGVRDHTQRLAQALQAGGVRCSMHWLARDPGGLGANRAQVAAWTRTLPAQLERDGADAVLLQYSVFSYSYRGVPLFVAPVLSALRRSGLPVITLAHEFAFPWRREGLRGTVWAVTQRAALVAVIRRSAALLLTTDSRARWLASRPWLPRRPSAVAPVFSNLPVPRGSAEAELRSATVGIFGYSYGHETAGTVLDALQLLQRGGIDVRLMLLGAPGPFSAEGEVWLEQARSRGLADSLGFSGTLPAQELSDELASCEIVLFADPSGPTSRKTTLAASLGSGRPVLALDGRSRWAELIEADAARVVTPSARSLAGALRGLLAAPELREALGERGRVFADQRMSVGRSTEVLKPLLETLADAGAIHSARRLRVLRVADLYAGVEGGARNYMLRSGAALESMGHEVSYLWREGMLPKVNSGALRRLLVPWSIALHALREHKRYDVIEVHEPAGAVYGVLRLLAGRRRLPALALLSYGLEGRSWAAYKERSRRTGHPIALKSRISVPLTLVSQAIVAAKTADVVIVPSTDDKEHLVHQLRVPGRRVVMAPSGVEEVFLGAPERPRTAEAIKLIFVGSWIDRKGTPELGAAWEALAADERLRLTLAGTGLAAEKVLDALSSKYADRVRVIPTIAPDDLREELLDSDIFVLASWFEGMPLSMLEAAACGLPCVVTSVCGVRDVFPDGEADSFGAITLPPHDSEALTAALASLIEQPERRAELGRRARNRARSFTWAASAQRIAAAYETAVGAEGRSPLTELPQRRAR